MELEFKSDFAETRRQWECFWSGHCQTPMISCVIPKAGKKTVEPPVYPSGYDGNFEPVIDRLIDWADSRLFLGAAVPFYYLEFGPDHFSSFLGCNLNFNQPGTSWAEHWVRDWDDVEIRFQRDSVWWQRTVEFIRALRRRLDGKMLIAPPTLVANLDALAALRGVNELMLDLAESPEKIHRALRQVDKAYAEILGELSAELDMPRWGSINRHGLYCRGRTTIPQCDCSCMIGPEMFAEFVLPHLKQEMAQLDAVEYHLDGPGAIKHLEALCSIEKLEVVQWVPGAGNERQDWTSLFRRIDQLGKGHLASVENIESLRDHWTSYQSRRIYYYYSGQATEQAAKEFLTEAEKIIK